MLIERTIENDVALLSDRLSSECEVTREQATADAEALIRAGNAARAAICNGMSPRQHYAEAVAVAKRYGAKPILNGDLNGMVIGLVPASTPFKGGLTRRQAKACPASALLFRNIWFVA